MIDYKLLNALATVFDSGSFEAAARQLHLTQSAVSQRVKLLESRCGQPLLIRSNPVQATQRGQQLLKHFRKVELLEAELQNELDGESSAFISLPIAVNADSLVTWFVDAIAPSAVSAKWLLNLIVDDQEETQRLLRQGDVVGCITVDGQPPQGCRSEFLGAMRYRCVATEAFLLRYFSDGLTREAVSNAPAITFNSKDRLHDEFIASLDLSDIESYPRHRLPSTGTFLKAIHMGLGYGVVPDLMLGDSLEQGSLIDLAPKKNVNVPLYWQSWGVDTPMLRQLSAAVITAGKQVLGAP